MAPPSATELLRKAATFVKSKKYQDAVDVYLQATETSPGDARAWFGLGVCLYRIGNLDVARIALERAQRMGYPKADEALSRLRAAEERRQERTAQKATQARPGAAAAAPAPKVPVKKVEMGRFVRVMLVEAGEADKRTITSALEAAITDVEVTSMPYNISSSDTMSGAVHYDVVVLDWDMGPDAARGLIQILRIKRPLLLIICLLDRWDPATAIATLEAGADLFLVKNASFATSLPMLIMQWDTRARATAQNESGRRASDRKVVWPAALDSIGPMLIQVDADYTIAQGNETALKALKRGRDEFTGLNYSQMLYGRAAPPDTCPLWRTIESGTPSQGNITLAETGSVVAVRAWPVLSTSGNVTSVVALLDPGESAEETPETSAQWLYRNLTEKSAGGIVLVGPDGNIEYANPAFCGIAGRTDSELFGHAVGRLVGAADRSALGTAISQAIASGKATCYLALRRADGVDVSVQARFSQFSTDDEDNFLVLNVMECAAQSSSVVAPPLPTTTGSTDPLDPLVTIAPDMFFRTDAEHAITWASPAAEHLLGCAADSLNGTALESIIAPDSRADAEQILDRAAQAGIAADGEVQVRRPDTRTFWAHLTLIPAPDGRGVEGILKDISDRKLTEAIRGLLSSQG
jgi:PAS domain S-box-containing protein